MGFGSIIGIYGNKAYYLVTESEKIMNPPITQSAYDTMRNNLKIHLYSISLLDGITIDIFNGTLYDTDKIVIREGILFWQSRREKSIKAMDLNTGETQTLVENISKDIYNLTVLDGRLIYCVSNALIENEETSPPNDMFFIDLNTGEKGEISYRSEDNGQPPIEIKDWGENVLVAVSAEWVSSTDEKKCWEMISKADFWNNNFENLQIMGN
jgi:hypothetical protein